MIPLLTCSAVMSTVILFYMAIARLLAKRFSSKGLYYAWLVIILGLIIPFRPHIDTAGIVSIGEQVETLLTGMPVQSIQTWTGSIAAEPISKVVYQPTLLQTQWWHYAAFIWLAGAIVFLVYQGIKHYLFAKMTGRWSESITDDNILMLDQKLKSDMGVSRRINLYLCPCIDTPMLVGVIKPRILLPKIENIAEDEIEFILRHELMHYMRKDIWYKLLELIAIAIHWFNPVVYLMAKVIDVQCELSCDAEIVKNTNIDTRQKYSKIIIDVIRIKSRYKTALSTNFYGGKKDMKNRILSIMNTKKKKIGFFSLFIALIMTLGTGVAYTNANTDIAVSENAVPENPVNISEEAEVDVVIRFAEYTNLPDASSTNVSYVDSRPSFEFYIEGEDIARIDVSCKTEYLYAVDWTKTQHEKYWNMEYYQTYDEESGVSTFYPDKLYAKSMTMTFDEGFSDYGDIWYRWTAQNLYEWAAEDNFSHFLLGGNQKGLSDMTEEEKLKLAAGDDGSGVSGIGHIQLNGYPEKFTMDRILITITDRQGNSTTKIIYIKVSNNEYNQTVVTANLE